MKKIQIPTLLLACLSVQTIFAADLSYEMNNLLQGIFGDQPFIETNHEPEPDIDIPEIVLPANVTVDDIIEFNARIQEEERRVEEFETKILDAQAELYELAEQKDELEEDLFKLDADLGLNQQRLKNLSEQEVYWETELKKADARLKELKTMQRIEQKEFQGFLSKNIIQKENLYGNESVAVLRWFFSDKTAGDILEEQRHRDKFQQYKNTRLRRLDELKNAAEIEEARIRSLHNRISRLKQDLELQNNVTADLVEAKAKRLNAVRDTSNQRSGDIGYLQREHQLSSAFLAELKKSMQTIDEHVREEEALANTETVDENAEAEAKLAEMMQTEEARKVKERSGFLAQIDRIKSQLSIGEDDRTIESLWQPPLKIPLKVTASFKDPSYEAKFGRPRFGVDFLANQGTALYAPASGTVIKTEEPGFGYAYLIIDHGDDTYSLFGHLSKILVSTGEEVQAGDKIGLTGGATGTKGAGPWSTGAHLHMEVFVGDKHQDPLKFIGK